MARIFSKNISRTHIINLSSLLRSQITANTSGVALFAGDTPFIILIKNRQKLSHLNRALDSYKLMHQRPKKPFLQDVDAKKVAGGLRILNSSIPWKIVDKTITFQHNNKFAAEKGP